MLSAMLRSSIAHSTISTRLFRGKMHSDWFNGIEILQGRWQHGEKVGHCYPSGLEKTLCKWDVYVLLVTKGLMKSKFLYLIHTQSLLLPYITHPVAFGSTTIFIFLPSIPRSRKCSFSRLYNIYYIRIYHLSHVF
jgi:hypothetical protein